MLRFFVFFITTPLVFASTLGDCFLEHSSQQIKLTTIKRIYSDEKKINGDSRDILGTPLYLAAKSGSLPLVTFLVKSGANINRANNSSDTPLHVASAYGYLDIVKYLIKHKAKIDKKNSIGKTALELASLRGKSHVVQYLKKSIPTKKIKSIEKISLKKQKREEESFQHLPYVQTLGIVSKSELYVKEENTIQIHGKGIPEVGNIIYRTEKTEERYEELPFVQSLEVVSKSKPYIGSKS